MSLIVELEKKNYPLVLNKLIEYFVSIEDYEECGKIKTLINKI